MNKLASFLCVLLLVGGLFAAAVPDLDPVPVAITNNAVATMKMRGDLYIYSVMGVGEKKTWDAVASAGFVFDNDTGTWTPIHAVPGTTGRIDATAIGLNGRVYLMGGSIVDAQGHETPVPDLNIYASDAEEWLRGADLPVPVTDAVSGLHRDRYVYVIGGRSRSGPVNDVQVYDLSSNSWQSATPLPGAPTFGGAGTVINDTIIYVDGATSYRSGDVSNACWIGKIEKKNPYHITWTQLPAHPGQPGFRIAAGASERDNKVYFMGGSSSATNYKGMMADGKMAQPFPMTFAFDLKPKTWEVINPQTAHVPMGNHVLVATEQGLVLIGGTDADGKVSKQMRIISKGKQVEAPAAPPKDVPTTEPQK